MMLPWALTGIALVSVGVVLYRRWRRSREPKRPGYLIPPGKPGSWYETFERGGKVYVRPTKETREAWSREESELFGEPQ
jgi:hypothetical protein